MSRKEIRRSSAGRHKQAKETTLLLRREKQEGVKDLIISRRNYIQKKSSKWARRL